MGSPPEETGHRADEVQVRVTLTRGFWTAKYEATQGQWRRIVGAFPNEAPSATFGEGDDVPVYWINFEEAEGFCSALTERARRGSSALPSTWEFRLPTEAQWEYACRAGTVTATAFGNRLGRRQANFGGAPLDGGDDSPAERRATKVGSYPANPWGISDMILARAEIDFRAPLAYGESVEISVGATSLGRSSFVLESDMSRSRRRTPTTRSG